MANSSSLFSSMSSLLNKNCPKMSSSLSIYGYRCECINKTSKQWNIYKLFTSGAFQETLGLSYDKPFPEIVVLHLAYYLLFDVSSL